MNRKKLLFDKGFFTLMSLCLLLSLYFPIPLWAQGHKIKGKVVDELNEPLMSVTIKVEGTKVGTSTNLNGEFSISLPKEKNVLVFSYVGYKTKKVKASDNMIVKLEPDARMLEGIVVETGYQKIDRRLFTGAAAQVKGKDALIEGMSDVSRMLQGKVAGIQVQNVSGTFGAAPKIRVRGASSILGNQKPLWVVDGVVLEDVVEVSADDLSSGNAATLISSAVAGLNADDIESFQILKDASATALYGARAMNGVVVITTKKGTKGAARVSYSGEFTFRERPRYEDYNILTSQEQMSIFREMADKGFLNFSSTSRSQDAGEFFIMSELINKWNPDTQSFGMPNTPEAREAFMNEAARRNTDWFKELFRPTLQQNHAVSISGGGDKTQFYGSLSFFNDPGWTIADNVKRFTSNINLGYNVSKQMRVNFLTNTSIRLQKVPGTQSRVFDNISGQYSRDFDINPFSYALNTSRTMRARHADGTPFFYQRNYAPFSIINELNENNIHLNMIDTKLQAELHYNPFKSLELSAIGSIRYVKSTTESRITEKSNQAMAYRAAQDGYVIENNSKLYKDPDNVNAYPKIILPAGGFYNTKDDFLRSYYWRATANFNKTFDDTHIVNILVGNEIKAADRTRRGADGYGLQFYKGSKPFTDYRMLKHIIEGGDNYFFLTNTYDRFVAFFGTASYSYMGRYTLNLTGRYDGSNLLGKALSARWLPTWNTSASWNIHDTFMPHEKSVSRLLLRGTYGLTASMGPARNSLPVFYNGRTFRGLAPNDEPYTYIKDLENKNLTWEKQHETNIGLDLGIFSNRISLSGDVYWRKGFDLIGPVVTSGIGGEETKIGNFANMESSGFEFTLNTVNLRTKDWTWTTNVTFSYNKSKITSLNSRPRIGDLTRSSGGAREGYPVRALFSLPFRGLNADGIPTFTLEKGGEPQSTGVNFQRNTDIDFLKYEGPIDPTVTGGIDTNIKWRGLSLGVYFTYQGGNVIRLSDDFSARYSDQQAMPREMLNRWRNRGDEKMTYIPVILSAYELYKESDYSRAYTAYNQSDARVAKGDFFRLKDVTLTYDLPRNLIQKVFNLQNAQLKFIASNVYLIYADKKLNGVDPEFSRSGGVALPTPHQYTLSLKVSF